jgi:hypothetical protein
MTVTRYQDLPLADRERRWDADAADKRVRAWAGAEDAPNDRYRKAFLWYDGERRDEFTAYKLPIADVVDGKLRAVPRGVMAAAGVLDGARGGVDVPHDDEARLRHHLERYYDKLGEAPPWRKAA